MALALYNIPGYGLHLQPFEPFRKAVSREPGTSRREQLRAIAIRERRIRRIIREVLDGFVRTIPLDELRLLQLIGSGDVDFIAERQLRSLLLQKDTLVEALSTDIRKQADDFVLPLGVLSLRQLAENQVGDLVREVTASQRAQLRATLVNLFEAGPELETLDAIRDTVGLTRRQAAAVERLRLRLIAEGKNVASAGRQAKAYAKRFRNFRARLIARTESVRYVNTAVAARARQIGALVQWVSARDDDVDRGNPGGPCIQNDNGTKIPVDEVFPSGDTRPPAHPGCRCILEVFSPTAQRLEI